MKFKFTPTKRKGGRSCSHIKVGGGGVGAQKVLPCLDGGGGGGSQMFLDRNRNTEIPQKHAIFYINIFSDITTA